MSIIIQVRRRRRKGNASGSAPITTPSTIITDVVSSPVCQLASGAASSTPIYAPFATVFAGVFYPSNNTAFAASAHCTVDASSLSTIGVTASSVCTNGAAASLAKAPTKLQVRRTMSKGGEVFSTQESQTFAIWTE